MVEIPNKEQRYLFDQNFTSNSMTNLRMGYEFLIELHKTGWEKFSINGAHFQ